MSSFMEAWRIAELSKDPCARKHGGNEASQIAHDSIVLSKREVYQKILRLAEQAGETGITVHDVCRALSTPAHTVHPNDVSGRLAELRESGALVWKRDKAMYLVRREGCGVSVRRKP